MSNASPVVATPAVTTCPVSFIESAKTSSLLNGEVPPRCGGRGVALGFALGVALAAGRAKNVWT